MADSIEKDLEAFEQRWILRAEVIGEAKMLARVAAAAVEGQNDSAGLLNRLQKSHEVAKLSADRYSELKDTRSRCDDLEAQLADSEAEAHQLKSALDATDEG